MSVAPTTDPKAPGMKKEPAPASAATKEPKAPKEAKPKKEKKEGAVARPRLPKFEDNHVITVLKENAKSRGANERFKQYHTGQTVKDYLAKMSAEPFNRTDGQTMADMRWDKDHGFIEIGPTVVPVPPPQPKPAPASTQPTA